MNSLRPMRLNSVFVCLCGLLAVGSCAGAESAADSAQQTPRPQHTHPPQTNPPQNRNNPFETVPQAEPPEAPQQPPAAPQFEAPKARSRASATGRRCRT